MAGNHDEEQANDIESLSILTSHSLATRSEWAPELEPCNTTSCAPWFQCQEGECQQGPSLPLDVLSSDNKLVWECNCVTYVNSTVEVGRCIHIQLFNLKQQWNTIQGTSQCLKAKCHVLGQV